MENNPGMLGQYTFRGGVEPITFIRSNKLSFLEGNIIKYVYRYPHKEGLKDLKKARLYLDWLIEERDRDSSVEAERLGGI